MDDLISRQAAIDVARKCSVKEVTPAYMLIDKAEVMTELMMLPSAHSTQPNTPNTLKALEALDCISRQDAINALWGERKKLDSYMDLCLKKGLFALRSGTKAERNRIEEDIEIITRLPSAQPEIEERMSETEQNVPNDDFISRKGAIDALMEDFKRIPTNAIRAKTVIEQLPSAQPERTCVNCGRTVNNGGWYADGGTRCPIEEHYALPKDGYCHLWEKRNVTDDDYPERREE